MADVEVELASRLERGEEVVVTTVVRLDGSPPSAPGAKLLSSRSALLAGTLGCSEFDSAALSAGAEALARGVPQLARFEHETGEVEVLIEPYAPRPLLLVVSATPVAAHLLEWAPAVGFATLLFESRPGRLSSPAAKGRRRLASLAELEALPDPEIYAVHTDHDDPALEACLTWALRAGERVPYVGVMGSRRHTAHVIAALPAGLDRGRVETPVGLDLGGRTPAEIALSILAGVVAVRHGASGGRLASPGPDLDPPGGQAGNTPS